jgi:hypothetical protein
LSSHYSSEASGPPGFRPKVVAQERAPVGVEGLELVLFQATQEMRGKSVHGVSLVAREFPYVRGEREG